MGSRPLLLSKLGDILRKQTTSSSSSRGGFLAPPCASPSIMSCKAPGPSRGDSSRLAVGRLYPPFAPPPLPGPPSPRDEAARPLRTWNRAYSAAISSSPIGISVAPRSVVVGYYLGMLASIFALTDSDSEASASKQPCNNGSNRLA